MKMVTSFDHPSTIRHQHDISVLVTVSDCALTTETIDRSLLATSITNHRPTEIAVMIVPLTIVARVRDPLRVYDHPMTREGALREETHGNLLFHPDRLLEDLRVEQEIMDRVICLVNEPRRAIDLSLVLERKIGIALDFNGHS